MKYLLSLIDYFCGLIPYHKKTIPLKRLTQLQNLLTNDLLRSRDVYVYPEKWQPVYAATQKDPSNYSTQEVLKPLAWPIYSYLLYEATAVKEFIHAIKGNEHEIHECHINVISEIYLKLINTHIEQVQVRSGFSAGGHINILTVSIPSSSFALKQKEIDHMSHIHQNMSLVNFSSNFYKDIIKLKIRDEYVADQITKTRKDSVLTSKKLNRAERAIESSKKFTCKIDSLALQSIIRAGTSDPRDSNKATHFYIVILDDVFTTGATIYACMNEIERKLEAKKEELCVKYKAGSNYNFNFTYSMCGACIASTPKKITGI